MIRPSSQSPRGRRWSTSTSAVRTSLLSTRRAVLLWCVPSAQSAGSLKESNICIFSGGNFKVPESDEGCVVWRVAKTLYVVLKEKGQDSKDIDLNNVWSVKNLLEKQKEMTHIFNAEVTKKRTIAKNGDDYQDISMHVNISVKSARSFCPVAVHVSPDSTMPILIKSATPHVRVSFAMFCTYVYNCIHMYTYVIICPT